MMLYQMPNNQYNTPPNEHIYGRAGKTAKVRKLKKTIFQELNNRHTYVCILYIHLLSR